MQHENANVYILKLTGLQISLWKMIFYLSVLKFHKLKTWMFQLS